MMKINYTTKLALIAAVQLFFFPTIGSSQKPTTSKYCHDVSCSSLLPCFHHSTNLRYCDELSCSSVFPCPAHTLYTVQSVLSTKTAFGEPPQSTTIEPYTNKDW